MTRKSMTLVDAIHRVLDAFDYEIEGYRMNPGESDAEIRELELAARKVEDVLHDIIQLSEKVKTSLD